MITDSLFYRLSNGIDGQVIRYRVVRKDGVWIGESAKVEAMS